MCCEELRRRLRELSHLDEMTEELATFDELHEEVDAELVLEHELHINQERVVDGVEDIFLKLDVLHLLVLENDILSDAFHGKELTCSLPLDEKDLAERTFANHLLDLEVFQVRFFLVSREDVLPAGLQ